MPTDESRTTECRGHIWFNVGYDHQCGDCGVFFRAERDRVASQCDGLKLPEIAALLRKATGPKKRVSAT